MQDVTKSLLFEDKIRTDNNMEEQEEEEAGGSSPFQRLKSKAKQKMDDLADDISREVKDELHDKRKTIKKAENETLSWPMCLTQPYLVIIAFRNTKKRGALTLSSRTNDRVCYPTWVPI